MKLFKEISNIKYNLLTKFQMDRKMVEQKIPTILRNKILNSFNTLYYFGADFISFNEVN